MESSSSNSLSHLNYLNLLLLRPVLAVSFVFSFIIFGWLLAWKLVLVHVPLVQEIFDSITSMLLIPLLTEKTAQNQQEIILLEFLHVWKDKDSPSFSKMKQKEELRIPINLIDPSKRITSPDS
ncbi:hypothetical protein LWI28_025896 [Acer negundo]|uniref:Uncharacterized protein n=1 Tax=Acer negundo TaxID=4023 RepID=A0AAD5P6H2_ACENE|nr:hypothetical protein LWI28_025896 [Acer negundo]